MFEVQGSPKKGHRIPIQRLAPRVVRRLARKLLSGEVVMMGDDVVTANDLSGVQALFPVLAWQAQEFFKYAHGMNSGFGLRFIQNRECMLGVGVIADALPDSRATFLLYLQEAIHAIKDYSPRNEHGAIVIDQLVAEFINTHDLSRDRSMEMGV